MVRQIKIITASLSKILDSYNIVNRQLRILPDSRVVSVFTKENLNKQQDTYRIYVVIEYDTEK